MNRKDILKIARDYDDQEVGINDIYCVAERGIESDLIKLQDESIKLGFVTAMRLIRDTPLGEIEDLVNSVLDD